MSLVVVLAVVGGAVVVRWWHDRPPFEARALGATATVAAVDNASVAAEIARAGVEPFTAPYADDGDQLMIATVAWRKPPRPLTGGWLAVLLIDKRTRRKPPVIAAGSPRPDSVRVGSDGVLNQVARRYPWLRGAGDIANGDGSATSGGESVAVSTDSSPVVLVAAFPAVARTTEPRTFATAPVTTADLMIAIVCIGADRQIYWAQRLRG